MAIKMRGYAYQSAHSTAQPILDLYAIIIAHIGFVLICHMARAL